MPKRVGNLYNKVISYENCFRAVMEGTEHLKRKDLVIDIRNRPHDYAHLIQKILKEGWKPGAIRYRILKEGAKRKKRKLVIASTIDHLIHTAIIRVAKPHLKARFDFYSCGSIDERGQERCRRAIRGWMNEKRYKYAAEADVYHFYDSCRVDIVMMALRKVFKDERYIKLHEKILCQMKGIGVQIINESDEPFDSPGLAVGFSPSHWYANLVLTECDMMLRHEFRGIKFVRYMDNYAMVSNRKRRLHNAILSLERTLNSIGMRLKEDWQVFRLDKRPIKFLSYRYYQDGRIYLTKQNLFRLSRKAKKTSRRPGAHNARSFMSVVGLSKKANTFGFRMMHVYPYISEQYCKKLISNHDKKKGNCYGTDKRTLQRTAREFRNQKIW